MCLLIYSYLQVFYFSSCSGKENWSQFFFSPCECIPCGSLRLLCPYHYLSGFDKQDMNCLSAFPH